LKWNLGKFSEIPPEYKGSVYCTLAGLITGILTLIIGFWKTMLIWTFMLAGFFVGKIIDTNPKIRKMIRDFFNPNEDYYD